MNMKYVLLAAIIVAPMALYTFARAQEGGAEFPVTDTLTGTISEEELKELLITVNTSQANLIRIERKLDFLLGNEHAQQVHIAVEDWKRVLKAATIINGIVVDGMMLPPLELELDEQLELEEEIVE